MVVCYFIVNKFLLKNLEFFEEIMLKLALFFVLKLELKHLLLHIFNNLINSLNLSKIYLHQPLY